MRCDVRYVFLVKDILNYRPSLGYLEFKLHWKGAVYIVYHEKQIYHLSVFKLYNVSKYQDDRHIMCHYTNILK